MTAHFDADRYIASVWPLLDDGSHNLTAERRARAKKKLAKCAPVTLAEHQAAELEARRILDSRIDSPAQDTPELDEEITDVGAHHSTSEIRQWAADVILDCKVWEYVAQDVLDFKATIEADANGVLSFKKGHAQNKAA
jgi:hypothetical protein